MVTLNANSGKIQYGVKEFICDTKEDIKKLPTDISIKVGSVALCIEDSSVYMFNSQRKWVEL